MQNDDPTSKISDFPHVSRHLSKKASKMVIVILIILQMINLTSRKEVFENQIRIQELGSGSPFGH